MSQDGVALTRDSDVKMEALGNFRGHGFLSHTDDGAPIPGPSDAPQALEQLGTTSKRKRVRLILPSVDAGGMMEKMPKKRVKKAAPVTELRAPTPAKRTRKAKVVEANESGDANRDKEKKPVKEPKAKTKAGGGRRSIKSSNQSSNARGPQWTVPSLQHAEVEAVSNAQTLLRPSIWCSSKDELVSALPELAKPNAINGIAWALSATPIIVLESPESDCIHVSAVKMLTVELTLTRDFLCHAHDLHLDLDTRGRDDDPGKAKGPMRLRGGAAPAFQFQNASSSPQPREICNLSGPASIPVPIPVPRGSGSRPDTFCSTYKQKPQSHSHHSAHSHLTHSREITPLAPLDPHINPTGTPSSSVATGMNSIPLPPRPRRPLFAQPSALSPSTPPPQLRASSSPSCLYSSSSCSVGKLGVQGQRRNIERQDDPRMHAPMEPWRSAKPKEAMRYVQGEEAPPAIPAHAHVRWLDGSSDVAAWTSGATRAFDRRISGEVIPSITEPAKEPSSVHPVQAPHDVKFTPPTMASPAYSREAAPTMQSLLPSHAQPQLLPPTEDTRPLGSSAPTTFVLPLHAGREEGFLPPTTVSHPLGATFPIPPPPKMHHPLYAQAQPQLLPPTQETPAPGPSAPTLHPPCPPPHPMPTSTSSSLRSIDPLQVLELGVPSTLPPEIAAVCDAYVAGTPVTLIAMLSILAQRWRVAVPEECGYAFLGFFKVTSVQERRLRIPADVHTAVAEGHVTGRVEWVLRCTWIPSGEEVFALGAPPLEELRPWWAPNEPISSSSHQPLISGDIAGLAMSSPASTSSFSTLQYSTSSTSLVASASTRISPPLAADAGRIAQNEASAQCDYEDPLTTRRYLTRRKAHPNYALRHEPLHLLYDFPLPLSVLAPPEDGAWDAGLASGWLCMGEEGCGRLNFQSLMRHRWCGSSFCKDRRTRSAKMKGKQKGKAEVTAHEAGEEAGYAVPLVHLRDPQQAGAMSHPDNTYPSDVVEGTLAVWDDGMQTLRYAWEVQAQVQKATNQDRVGRAAHVFTGNSRSLQQEADVLLREVQIHVPLRRETSSSAPYFSYKVGSSPTSSKLKDGAPVPVAWSDAPECVMRARDVMLARVQDYAELEVTINELTILAWITSGTRKAYTPLHARTHPIVLMNLGCETVVTLAPRAGFRGVEAIGSFLEGKALLSMDVDEDIDMDVVGKGAVSLGAKGRDTEQSEMDVDLSAVDAEFLGHQPMDIDIEAMPSTATARPLKTPAKEEKRVLVVSLVHGDILVLSGDVFEYSIKRIGTSILLLGSTVEKM
ncbi:hypothetical protein DXG03_008800 [Asterophora parasitica]|uniref:Uncharacterized protein n=1 Tax=Asterophora parasitica TaxID=117018 RepID=A0A9P7GC05_9AGAR|nr:hypothetical protein DXG03_008800 [Asterophora parasitica]